MDIKNWHRGEVIYSGKAETIAKLLEQAVKEGVYLDGANLNGANLKGANLYCANLNGAILSDKTIIETRETWKQYLAEVVPALLTAGGRELKQVLKPEHWNCHSWENCPMAVAFNTTGITGIPVLLRPRADQFIRYFDSGVIPLEAVGVGLRALAP